MSSSLVSTAMPELNNTLTNATAPPELNNTLTNATAVNDTDISYNTAATRSIIEQILSFLLFLWNDIICKHWDIIILVVVGIVLYCHLFQMLMAHLIRSGVLAPNRPRPQDPNNAPAPEDMELAEINRGEELLENNPRFVPGRRTPMRQISRPSSSGNSYHSACSLSV